MARPNKVEIEPGKMCNGGVSFGCRHDSHRLGKRPDILCRLCGARLGCSVCCQIAVELVCLRCHQWADILGERHHGKMVPQKIQEKLELTRQWVSE